MGMVEHIFNTNTQEDLCEFKASLNSQGEFKDSQGYILRSCDPLPQKELYSQTGMKPLWGRKPPVLGKRGQHERSLTAACNVEQVVLGPSLRLSVSTTTW